MKSLVLLTPQSDASLVSYTCRLQCMCHRPNIVLSWINLYSAMIDQRSSVYYTKCHEFLWSCDTLIPPPTARECVIMHLEQFFKLSNREDQCLWLSLASFGCVFKLKICVWRSLSYLHCHGNINIMWLLHFTQWMADRVMESKHFVWSSNSVHIHRSFLH